MGMGNPRRHRKSKVRACNEILFNKLRTPAIGTLIQYSRICTPEVDTSSTLSFGSWLAEVMRLDSCNLDGASDCRSQPIVFE